MKSFAQLLALLLTTALVSRSSAQAVDGPVTETVDDIMGRQHARGHLPHGFRVKEEKLANYRGGLKQDPDSPEIGQTGGETNVAPAAAAPQTAGTSFLAIQVSESGFIPPDTQIGVGPSQILTCANGRIKVFDRNGVLGPLNADLDVFFSPVTGNSTTDPRVRFDRLTQRWFVLAIDIPNSKKNNKVLIAVSSGPTITGTASFTFYAFTHSAVAPSGDTGLFADYPTLGIDRHALYIGVNLFSSVFYGGTSGYVINKSNLITGTLTVTPFRQLAPPSGAGPYTPQGVDNDDPNSNEGYFIGVDNVTKGRLVVRRVSNPGGTPTISGNLNITVATTTDPLGSVPNLGGGALDDIDDRLYAATLKNGSLWTAHNIEVNASGVADSAGGRDGSRWYEITNLTTTPTLRQSGTVFDSAGSNPANYWIPTIAMSGQGHVALGCSVAGNTQHAEIAVAGRLATDPLGTLSTPTVVQTSAFTYNVSSIPQRWGDYSIVLVDPLDDMTLWTGQEYCNANNSWGVRVIQLKAPPPALPTNCSPAIIPAGTNVNLLITGLSSNGSGYFDPGPAFPKHIGASVSGTGVTVNSTTYLDPLHITLNVTVAAGTPSSARSISITNPDGQLVMSTVGIFAVTNGAPGNHPPNLPAISDRTVNEGSLLSFTINANDPDGDALTFALINPPAGASINSSNGLFTWTPSETQGPGTNTLTARVSDNGSPSLSATQTFTVTVNEVNSAPVLAGISNRLVYVGESVSFTATATDTDLPPNTLTFSLEPGAPASAAITGGGLFTWTPTNTDIGPHTIGVRVTDNGVPPASDVESFSVGVAPPPFITRITHNDTNVTVRWISLPGRSYRLQFKPSFDVLMWSALPGVITAVSNEVERSDSLTNVQRFYRVEVLP
jgi:hypothetical protein